MNHWKHQFFFLWPFIKLGLTDILRHKTRSFLTMLGMVFGVGSVIAMLAVGEGASEQALEAIRKMGCENILLSSIKPPNEGGGKGSSSNSRLALYGLLHDDEIRIRETIPGVRLTVPARMTQRDARLNEKSLQFRVVETVPEWFDVVRRSVVAGRVLSDSDQRFTANACVLTEMGARKLLAGESGIGERIRIGSAIFQVVGIVSSDAGGVEQAPDSEADAYIPIATGLSLFGETNMRYVGGGRSTEGERVELSQIIVQMEGIEQVEPGAAAIQAMLKRFHRKEDFAINVPLTLLRETERTKKMYNVVLGAIAGISLLVGGIGIMNIMLASVTELARAAILTLSCSSSCRSEVPCFLAVRTNDRTEGVVAHSWYSSQVMPRYSCSSMSAPTRPSCQSSTKRSISSSSTLPSRQSSTKLI